MASPTKIGLILTGGGARAAYQVGVLSAVAQILKTHSKPELNNIQSMLCVSTSGPSMAKAKKLALQLAGEMEKPWP